MTKAIRVTQRVQRALELHDVVFPNGKVSIDTATQTAELNRLVQAMTKSESDAYYRGVAIRRGIS